MPEGSTKTSDLGSGERLFPPPDPNVEQRRLICLNTIDLIGQFWRDGFNQKPFYSGANAWFFFTRMWRSAKSSPSSFLMKVSDAATIMPEMKSLAGAKAFLEKAWEDKYVNLVYSKDGKSEEVDFETYNYPKEIIDAVKENNPSLRTFVDKDDFVFMPKNTIELLDSIFDRCAGELESSSQKFGRF